MYFPVRLLGIALVLIFSFNVKATAAVILLADGGIDEGIFGGIGDPERKWRNLKLTISIENGAGVERVRGVVAHPYGDGPFEVEILAPDMVLDASFTTSDRHLVFDLQLSGELSDDLTALAFAKPVPEVEQEVLDILRIPRPGAFYEGGWDYPYPVIWEMAEALGSASQPLDVHAKTNPVIERTDIALHLRVTLDNFPTPVRQVSIIEMKERSIYPPWILEWDGEQYSRSFLLVGIGEHPEPLTFEVVTEQGQVFHLPVSPEEHDYRDVITLRPASHASHWTLYH